MTTNPSPSSRGISPGVFILSLLLTLVGTALFTTLVHHYAEPRVLATSDGRMLAVEPAGPAEPLNQKDTVTPEGKFTGVAFYPQPFASPPSLKFSSPKRKYDIVKQDEFGFTWAARPMAEDFIKEMPGGLKVEDYLERTLEGVITAAGNLLKKDITYEDFRWEANGVRGSLRTSLTRPFEQTGTFLSIIQTEGEVAFPIPYALPPNVELKGKGMTTVTQIKPTGFKWKNGGDNAFFYNGEATWTAKGMRAIDLSKLKSE